MTLITGEDAAYVDGITRGFSGPVAGYLASPFAYHPWSRADWDQFPQNPKLPIWVAGYQGRTEAREALGQLKALGVPQGCPVALDMEARTNAGYVRRFCEVLLPSYKTIVYGSASTVFTNSRCHGYWVALYDGSPEFPPTWPHGVLGKQYAANMDGHDLSAWLPWAVREFWTR